MILMSAILSLSAVAAMHGKNAGGYIREEIYDTSVHQDEAVVNVKIVNSRWPDCTTLKTAVHDMFRLEGVEHGTDQEKALALWKWFRLLTSSTGGSYAYELQDKKWKIVHDPHKILTVYGHHQCDGLSWAMVALWRAAGYMAHDCCTWGHTTTALRYKDVDGVYRYHSFDPQGRFYYWDDEKNIVGVRSMPIMTGMVYRHVTAPIHLHSLRTSLRVGEKIERRWDNRGHLVPSGEDKLKALESPYYAYAPGKKEGIYAVAGEEVKILQAETDPAWYTSQLYDGSRNTACSPPGKEGARLHPRKSGETALFIYRSPPPYVIVEAKVEAVLMKSSPDDTCRLSFSSDGKTWHLLYEKKSTGREKVSFDIGFKAWRNGRPHVYTKYNLLVRAEFKTAEDVRGVGMDMLRIKTIRMLNKRTLPNLRPGRNYIRVTANNITEGLALEVRIVYMVKGREVICKRFVRSFPYYFVIDVQGVKPYVRKSYDQDFNNGELRMVAYSLRLVRSEETVRFLASMPEREGAAAFKRPKPHPADMTRRKVRRPLETNPMQTDGFFPQSTTVLQNRKRVEKLLRDLSLPLSGRRSVFQWRIAQELGNYPEAVDGLCKRLRTADGDLTLFIVKALAQIADPRSVKPLLQKWRKAPEFAPGTRYIPDALAAIGDQSVVPELVRPLKRLRFDFRFHIAYALSILGGPLARKTLEDLARNDPFTAVREFAARALKKGVPAKPVSPSGIRGR